MTRRQGNQREQQHNGRDRFFDRICKNKDFNKFYFHFPLGIMSTINTI